MAFSPAEFLLIFVGPGLELLVAPLALLDYWELAG